MAVLLAVAVVLFPRFSEGRPEHEMATLARGEKPARVVCYRCFSSTFPWVLRRPVAVADERGELGSDGVYPPRLYWGRQEFWRRWDSGERLVAFARGKDIGDFSRPGHRPARVLLERDGAALLANYGPP